MKKVDPGYEWLQRHATGWQYGEQGILSAVLSCIGDGGRLCVEYGAGNGGNLPLTIGELVSGGWDAVLIEADENNAALLRDAVRGTRAVVLCDKVDETGEKSVDSLVRKAGFDAAPDVLVVDVDGPDYYHVAAMTTVPRVLVVEHHDVTDPMYPDYGYVPPRELAGLINGPGNFRIQANAQAIQELGESKGLTLVARTRVNSIFVRYEEAPKVFRTCVKLNLGSGDKKLEGYTNLDIKSGDDCRTLAYPDASVSEVRASHLLEHFPYEDIVTILKEWARVLEPGGLMKIAVPDLARICEDRRAWSAAVLDRLIFGGHKDETDGHKAGFDRDVLMRAMWAAGIGAVCDFEADADDCSRHPYSLNLMGVKRHWEKIENPKIVLVLSQPRITFTRHEEKVVKLRGELGFEVEYAKGAFWDRDMEITVEHSINKHNPDFLLFSDYDSVFHPEDVKKLLDFVNNDPTAAAVGVVQMSRHDDRPLVFDETVDYSGPVTKVRFQHFGLTLIRADVFHEMQHPWFWSMPGVDTQTGEVSWRNWNRSDADIMFWRRLTEHGFNVYQHNEVCIGHEIHAIKWPSKVGKGFILQPAENYDAKGKPAVVGFNDAIFRKKLEEKRREAAPPVAVPTELGNPEE